MSPVVLRKGQYTVVIYVRDHPPAHVHIFSAEKAAIVGLKPVEVWHNYGFKSREIRQLLALIQEHLVMLLEAWSKFHEE